MPYQDLILDKGSDGIATVTLNQPEKLNAFSEGMRKSMRLVCDEVAKDDQVRVVIITGNGRAFSSGADLSRDRGERTRYERIEVTGPTFGTDLVFKLDKPVIAAVNGVCAGMGFSLALSCDIRIASEAARFISVFVRRGLVPDCGLTYLLPKAVGMSKALEMMFTGQEVNAADALKFGLVSQVVPPEKLMDTCRELALKIADQPPLSIELTKRVAKRAMAQELESAYYMETYAQRSYALPSDDRHEAVKSFLEKRPHAPWKGA